MERIDTDTTILPLDITTELDRLERHAEAIDVDESSDIHDRREELAQIYLRQAQIYLGLESIETEEEALERLDRAWDLRPGSLDTLLLLDRLLIARHALGARVRILFEGARHAKETDIDLASQWLLRAIDVVLHADSLTPLVTPLEEAFSDPQLVSLLVQHTPQVARNLSDRLLRGQMLDLAHTILERLVVERHDESTFEDALNLAHLREDLKKPQAAFEAYRMALSIRPAAPEALDPTRRHLLDTGRYEELAELLAVSAPAAPHPRARATLWRELALLAEGKLVDPNRAIQAWWRTWELGQEGDEPTHLKRLYAKEERWSRYLDVLRQEILRTAQLAPKIDLLRELAAFQRDVLENKRDAAKTLDSLLQLAPDDEEALSTLVDLREAISKETSATDAEISAALHTLRRALAVTSDTTTQKPLRRRLIHLQMDHELFHGLLRELHHLDLDDAEDVELLRQSWRHSLDEKSPLVSQRRALTMLLLRAITTSPPHATAINEALEIAKHCEARGDRNLAAQVRRQIAALAPDHPQIKEALGAHLSPPREATPQQLLTRLAERAAKVQGSDEALATRFLLHAAQIGRHHEDTEETARQFLLTARDICPPDAQDELLLLESALTEAGLHDDVASLLEARIQRSQEKYEQIKLLFALASHRAKRQRKPRGATEVLEKILALDPQNEEVITQLQDLYHKLRDDRGLAKILERQLEMADGKTRISLLTKLGTLYGKDRLDDEARALKYYGELLRLQPHHREALAVVRAHAENAGDPRTVAVLLSRAAEAHDDPETRKELHREIARIAEEQLGDLDFAIGQWRQLLALYPEQGEGRHELERLLRLAQRWNELEVLLISEISRQTSDTERVRIYLELADLAKTELDNPRGAASHLRNAQKLAPQDDTVLEKLASLHEELGQWQDLATILIRRGNLEATPLPRRVSFQLQAARVLLNRLNRHEEAQEICQQARELAPDDGAATNLLKTIYTHHEDWGRLASLLREEIALKTDPHDLATLHSELGELLLDHLDSPEAAATHFEMALEFDSKNRDVLDLLRRLYATLGRWDLLVELIRRRAQADGLDKAGRTEALFEMGEIYRKELDDTTAAKEAYSEALKLIPDFIPALSAQRAIAIKGGAWRDAVSLARRELDAIDDTPAQARLLVEIARILDEKLARPDDAADALEEAITKDPHNAEAIEHLAAMTFAAHKWERAIELLMRLVESGEDLPDLHIHHYRLGYALEHVDDEDKAFAHYVKSFGREPMYLPTLDRLVDLCFTRHQWENTLRIAEALISTYADDKTPQELADYYVRMGLCELHLAQTEVAHEKLRALVLSPGERPKTGDDAWQDVATSWAATSGDPPLVADVDFAVITRVIKAMEQALARVPEHTDALQLLAALTMARGDWDRTLLYLERASDSCKEDEDQKLLRLNLLIAAGDIAAHRLLSARRAESYYRQAQAVDPSAGRVQRRLESIHDRPKRTPSPRKPRLAPRSRPRPTPHRPSPPPVPPKDDDLFDAMRTQPINLISEGDITRARRRTPVEQRPLPPKKKT